MISVLFILQYIFAVSTFYTYNVKSKEKEIHYRCISDWNRGKKSKYDDYKVQNGLND